MSDNEEFLYIIFGIMLFIVGMGIGVVIGKTGLNIQEIKQTEEGYYITINDEIYYKENSNDS